MDTISTSQALQIAGRAGRSDSVLNTSVVFKVKKKKNETIYWFHLFDLVS